jgi:hypothetical protein
MDYHSDRAVVVTTDARLAHQFRPEERSWLAPRALNERRGAASIAPIFSSRPKPKAFRKKRTLPPFDR